VKKEIAESDLRQPTALRIVYTILVVFYIRNQFAQSTDHWFPWVQKAEQWLNTSVGDKEGEIERLFEVIARYWPGEDASEATSDTVDGQKPLVEVLG
jgi:hypothetical protein